MKGNFEVLDAPVVAPDALAYLSNAFRSALVAAQSDEAGEKQSFNKETRKYYRSDPRAFRCMLSVLQVPRIAEAIRTRAAEPYLDHMDLLIKEAGAPETGWHQDRSYWAWDQPASMFTIWIALADMDPEAGCLRFAGGDVREVYPHRMLGYGPSGSLSALLIDPAQFDVGSLELHEIPLRAGCAAVFDSFTVHGAFPNRSDRPRLSFKLVIGDRAQRAVSGGSHIMRLYGSGYDLNRRLGYLPAFVGLHARDALVSRGRRVLRKWREAHGAR